MSELIETLRFMALSFGPVSMDDELKKACLDAIAALSQQEAEPVGYLYRFNPDAGLPELRPQICLDRQTVTNARWSEHALYEHPPKPAALPQPVEECSDCIELIGERDNWEERATALADAVGEYFGVPVGEHTSANCPINEAMKILDGEYQTPAVEKAWSRFQAAINAPQPVASVPQDVEEWIKSCTHFETSESVFRLDSIPVEEVRTFLAQRDAGSNEHLFITDDGSYERINGNPIEALRDIERIVEQGNMQGTLFVLPKGARVVHCQGPHDKWFIEACRKAMLTASKERTE